MYCSNKNMNKSLKKAGKMSTVNSILNMFGMTPDKLSHTDMEKLSNIAKDINSVSDITPDVTKEIMGMFNIKPPEKQKPRTLSSQNHRRNDKCYCGSGLKYKKCCINI